MYNDYFGFREKPFGATPNPRLFYSNPSYEEVYANLVYGIREHLGLVVLTGEVGTGKTTLLRKLMDNLDETVRFAFIYNSPLFKNSPEAFFGVICEELGLPFSGGGLLQTIHTLNTFLISQHEQGGTVALLIDEAQNLTVEDLENLRLLSNLETTSDKLVQIILIGQPELEVKLALPNLRQLRQRIVIRCQLDRLKDREIAPFINSRLRAAGNERQDLFTSDAIQRISVYAKGIPRLINIICDNALLVAFGLSKKTVSGDIIEEVASDLRLTGQRPTVLKVPRETEEIAVRDDTARSPMPEQPAFPSLFTPSTRPPIGDTKTNGKPVQTAPPLSRPLRRQRYSMWAVLLISLLGSGVAASYSSPAREQLTGLALKTENLLGTAKARVLSFMHDLNVRVGLSQQNIQDVHETVPDKSPSFDPAGEPQALTGQNELYPLHEAASSLGYDARPAYVAREEAVLPADTPHLPIRGEKMTQKMLEPQEQEPEQSPASPPRSTKKLGEGKFIVIQPNDFIAREVLHRYGTYNALAFDLIKDLNPHVDDLDQVMPGQTIWLPPLTQDTLLRKQSDTSYSLILAVFLTQKQAQEFTSTIRSQSHNVRILPHRLSASLVVHRVEIVGLKDLQQVKQAWKLVRIEQSLFPLPSLSASGASADESRL